MSRSGPVTKDTSTVALGLAQIRVGQSAANIATATAVLTSAESIGALASTKFTGNVDYWKMESGFPMLEDITLPIRESAKLECEFKELTPYNFALARGIDPKAAVSATIIGGDATGVNCVGNGTIDPTKAIVVTDAGGVVSELVTIVFDGADTANGYGSVTGLFTQTLTAKASAFTPTDGTNPYFSIPADFFTGTWAAEDTYTFHTVAAIAAGAGAFADSHTGTINIGALTAPEYVRMEAVYTYPNGTNTMTIIFPRANATSSVEVDMKAEDNVNVPLVFEAKRSDSDLSSGGNAVWDSASLGKVIFA